MCHPQQPLSSLQSSIPETNLSDPPFSQHHYQKAARMAIVAAVSLDQIMAIMQHLRKRLGKIDEVVVRLLLLRFQLPQIYC